MCACLTDLNKVFVQKFVIIFFFYRGHLVTLVYRLYTVHNADIVTNIPQYNLDQHSTSPSVNAINTSIFEHDGLRRSNIRHQIRWLLSLNQTNGHFYFVNRSCGSHKTNNNKRPQYYSNNFQVSVGCFWFCGEMTGYQCLCR